mmetsp:Transcript_40496/g.90850  ORF Transcript_40496/g.90850 Transcript_40496/m.90850 type:complete len:102 (-) Transcript_40496:351-656(-)
MGCQASTETRQTLVTVDGSLDTAKLEKLKLKHKKKEECPRDWHSITGTPLEVRVAIGDTLGSGHAGSGHKDVIVKLVAAHVRSMLFPCHLRRCQWSSTEQT